MITGAIRSQVDTVWNAFWSGGVSNPLTVIEQITYLLFAKRLDDLHTAREKQANLLKTKIENPIFGKGQDNLRWSRFKDFEAERMYEVFRDEVFPFIKQMHGDKDSAFSRSMKDAVFVIPKPSLLAAVVDLIGKIPMDDRDTKGDLYEYMLGKIATAGQNGQFRTPRHLIRMMVELMEPTPKDVIADPACETCGFLVAAGEYLREHHPKLFHNKRQLAHFQSGMFHGDDFDGTMLRIGAMNMMLHGIESPDLHGEDSLSQDADAVRDRYTLILANPPFKGSLNYDETAKDLLQMCKTKKTELLFLALFLAQLKPGGRCAAIVPDGVLFGSSKAHQQIREQLVDGQKLDAVIDMPSGVFKPYAGVSTAILIFTKTNSGGTDHVWFYT
jgi:type I restriction enzyme M protein